MEYKSIFGIVALLVVFVSEGANGISRSTVISNADTWLYPSVSYSQTRYMDGYRTDSSGYVSMAWETGPPGYTTSTLSEITEETSQNDLKSGDILLDSGFHVVIFDSWANSAKARYWGYEQEGYNYDRTVRRIIQYPYSPNGNGYEPRRYVNISD